MKLKKRFHNDLSAYPTPSLARILAGEAAPAAAPTYTPRHRRWLTAPIAVAMACLLTFGAAAAGVTAVMQYLNRDIIAENAVQLTAVPEGYTGIYTAADLVQMAEDIQNGTNAERYILMDDITFTDADFAEGGICEGGWVPINTDKYIAYANPTEEYPDAISTTHAFIHTFHGNGHVIRNLHIHAAAPADATFRSSGIYVGLFGESHAEILHLGMEDCTITLDHTVTDPYFSYDSMRDTLIGSTIHIGAIAGHADYIGGCYVSGVSIDVQTDFAWNEYNIHMKEEFGESALYNVNVGGIAGSTTYADACYAEDVSIRVHTEGDPYARLYAGVLAGRATSCVTSWAQGSIETSGDGWREQNTAEVACSHPTQSFPTVIPKESFELLLETVDAYYGAGEFYTKLFRAYFLLKDTENVHLTEELRTMVQTLVDGYNKQYAFASGHTDTAYTAFYVFDPTASPLELERIGTILSQAFASEQAYLDFCHAHNIRIGLVACHAFAPDATVTAQDIEGFDLETLWHIVDGKPRLQMFG